VEVNAQQRSRFVAKIQRALHGSIEKKKVAVLGLAFKPGTDDVRQAASIDVIRHLEDLGAIVMATDPVAQGPASRLLPATRMVSDPYDCVRGADAVVLVTEWPEYRALDWARVAQLVRRHVVIDGRNCLDGDAVVAAGFTYISIGRPIRRPVGKTIARRGRTETASAMPASRSQSKRIA
jgi:UDPglucose 6-dehydrogenase